MSFQALLISNSDSNNPGVSDWYTKCDAPTHEITSEQCWWIVKHTISGAIIGFGVNFAAVTASFYGKDDVKLFEFPSTLVGTYALTMFIQISMSWLINGIVMTLEIRDGKIPPLDPSCVPWWPKEGLSSSAIVYYSSMTELILPPSRVESKLNSSSTDKPAWSAFFSRLFYSQLRSAPWMVLIGLTLLPVFTVITFALYGLDEYNGFPQPEILVGIFGVLIVLLTAPFWTINTLAYVGYRLLDDKS